MRQVFVSQITNLQNFSQMQKEAALGLLILVMYADGVVDPDEAEYIDRLLLDSTWESENDLDAFIDDTKARVLEALSNHKILERFIEHKKLEIGDKEKLQSIYTICATMANSDHRIDDRELEILKILMESLR